jgi:cellulose synthase/poly-beta-1,6-N-acetylglucosamine synthase-like glycosyltransferase
VYSHLAGFKTAFFVFLFLILYSYFGYPLVLLAAGLVFGRKRRTDEAFRPSVTLIISAHNEEACIAEKIQNALDLDYPADKLEILVASDASADRTVDVARGAGARVRVLDFPDRAGKMGTLNKAVREARGEILVLTDANAMFAGYTIKELVKSFADPRVGCVSGNKIIRNTSGDIETGEGEMNYWKYESFLKYAESLTGSCMGADGAVYAVRKDLYPFPADRKIIMDDFAVSHLVMKRGRLCVFEPAARAFEESSKRIRDEFRRKSRIFAGIFSFFIQYPGVFISPFIFKFFSHRVLRYLTFPFQAALFCLSYLLADLELYRPVFGLQVVFYACAVMGVVLNRLSVRLLIFQIPYYINMTTFAQIAGIWHYFRHGRKPFWERRR